MPSSAYPTVYKANPRPNPPTLYGKASHRYIKAVCPYCKGPLEKLTDPSDILEGLNVYLCRHCQALTDIAGKIDKIPVDLSPAEWAEIMTTWQKYIKAFTPTPAPRPAAPELTEAPHD